MLRRLTFAILVLSCLVARATAGTLPSAHVDDDALRYYASLGQSDRVAAEAKRLEALDPNWKMPDDLYAARPGRADEAPLWALFKYGRFADITQAIAMRRAVEPGWTPSEDFTSKLRTRQVRIKIVAMAKDGHWPAIVQSVKEGGIAWAKDDAEALWVIAEAYARGNNCGEAYVIYHSILADHMDANERRATIEYAIPLIPMAMTEKLIAMGHTTEGGLSEFDPIAVDITRARMSAFLHDEPANEISDTELRRFEDFVHESNDPNAVGLVAWYAFKRHDYDTALDWFKLAMSRGGDAMIAHGLAHTLRRLDRTREAEEVTYAWREPLVNNQILFIDLLETKLTQERPPYIEPDRVARYAAVTMATESGEGAQALAWYAYNTCQYPLALQWFERATAWLPKEATVYGYALALQRLRRAKEFRDIVNRYDGLFPKVVALAFDDGVRTPPVACGAPTTIDGSVVRTMADTLRTQPLPRMEAMARAKIPSPDTLFSGAGGLGPMKKLTEFPVAIASENPLRFSALATVRTTGEGDGYAGQGPLVARRVPGVGAMPYERYGFGLLPGWDGSKAPSSPTAMEHPAAAGTLWALEQSLRDASYTPAISKAGAELALRSGGKS